MAIESLKLYEFTPKSDVWSFGVLLFELFSMGDVPFPEIQPADMIEHLEGGNRLIPPPSCSEEMFISFFVNFFFFCFKITKLIVNEEFPVKLIHRPDILNDIRIRLFFHI
uniref:Protein kinase domain-containing protein n=1 Tax=Ascaris lumbricoides TaxID=6252 RepID=A0A0M3HHD7_ASCLU